LNNGLVGTGTIYRESVGRNVLRALYKQFVEIHLAESHRGVSETARTETLFRNHIDVRDFDKTLKPLLSNSGCLPTAIIKSIINDTYTYLDVSF